MTISSKHPLLATGNLAEACLGLFAVGAATVTLFTVGPLISVWISLVFAVSTTAIALFSAYHLWSGN